MRRKRIREESNLDLTPMLDIVFIMLIFLLLRHRLLKNQVLRLIDQMQRQQKEIRRVTF